MTDERKPMTIPELVERNANARHIYDQLITLQRMEYPPIIMVSFVDGQQQMEFIDNPENAPIREVQAKYVELLEMALRIEQDRTP